MELVILGKLFAEERNRQWEHIAYATRLRVIELANIGWMKAHKLHADHGYKPTFAQMFFKEEAPALSLAPSHFPSRLPMNAFNEHLMTQSAERTLP